MGTVPVDQPETPACVAEKDEVLAEHANPAGHWAEVARELHRLPVAAQVLAGRCARTDTNEPFVVVTRCGVVIPVERHGTAVM